MKQQEFERLLNKFERVYNSIESLNDYIEVLGLKYDLDLSEEGISWLALHNNLSKAFNDCCEAHDYINEKKEVYLALEEIDYEDDNNN